MTVSAADIKAAQRKATCPPALSAGRINALASLAAAESGAA